MESKSNWSKYSIVGTERHEPFCLITEEDFYKRGDVLTSEYNDIKYIVLNSEKYGTAFKQTILLYFDEEELENAIRHFKFLRKHGII